MKKTIKQILFTKVNTAELVDVEYKEPHENAVLVKTVISSISCGTEKANITGDPNCGPYKGCTDRDSTRPF